MAAEVRGKQYQRYLLDIMAIYRQRQDLKVYLELLLSLAAIGMFIIFAIKPTLITIADLLVKINSEQETSDLMTTKISNLTSATTLFNKERDNIALLQTAIPSGPSVDTYVRQVEGVSQKDSLTLSNLSIAKVELIPTVSSSSADVSVQKTINLTLSITGNYESLLSFLKDLENLRRPGNLNKLNITTDSSDKTNQTLDLTSTSLVPYN